MTRACSQPLPPRQRAVRTRARCAMPRRTPPEIIELIDKLLLKGMAPLAVQDYLRDAKGYIVSITPISREAAILERMGKITRSRKVRAGMSTGGRKKLAEGEKGKRWSKHRERVLELRNEKGMSSPAIAAQITAECEARGEKGITRQGVERIIRAEAPPSPTKK